MLRTRLLTATAAVALFAAGSAFAQTAPATPPMPETMPAQTAPAPAAAPQTAPATAAAPATTPAAQNTVVDVLRANGQFTTLLSALDAAQLTDTLNTQSAVSIFAPTDAAFAALPEADRTRLLDPANVNELRQLLLYHVVVADVNSSQIEGAKGGVQTAANTEVQLDGTGETIKVDNATVTTADIDAGNGSIFIIDRVLNPATSLVASGDAEEAADAPAASEATPPTDEADVTAPAADDDMNEATPPAPNATDAAMPPVPAAPSTMAPAAAPMTAPTAPITSTRPASGETAPTGQPAATTTTVASPPVPNPTDGQVDDEDDMDMPAAPAPTPPVATPEP